MKRRGSFVLAGHTRRLFLINSDVRKNKQSADPANYALFYLIRGGGSKEVGEPPSGTNASLLLGGKINTSRRSRAGLFGQEVESSF